MTSLDTPRRDHGGLRPPWSTFILAGFALVLYALFGARPEALIFTRDGIQAGELWRLFTGHLVHTGTDHLVWNLIALLVLGSMFEILERPSPRRYFAIFAVGCLTIDAALWWGQPGLLGYCGLSGVLTATFALAVVAGWRATGSPWVLLGGAGVLAKIGFEMATGQTLFADTAWPPVPLAHAAGLLVGLAFLLPVRRLVPTGGLRREAS